MGWRTYEPGVEEVGQGERVRARAEEEGCQRAGGRERRRTGCV